MRLSEKKKFLHTQKINLKTQKHNIVKIINLCIQKSENNGLPQTILIQKIVDIKSSVHERKHFFKL